LAALRAIPEVVVLRPADANETVEAWKAALEHKGSPVALMLTRQKVPVLDRSGLSSAINLNKGAYIIKDCDGEPQLILMATGSEVSITLKAADKLNETGIKTRVISFPSWELFEKQSDEYKEAVLPSKVKARVSVEAGVSQGWEKYVGHFGESISIDKFGKSAPYKLLFEKYGFSVENIVKTSERLLKKLSGYSG
jgi:transketolase